MAQLYPPQIEGVIPAFTGERGKGTRIRVPFYMNKTVGWNEISGFQLKVKNVSNNLVVLTCDSTNYDTNEYEVYFDISADDMARMILGNFYKLQIAYIEKASGGVGYYSTVGVAKYTSYPEVSIVNLSQGQINLHMGEYEGVYYQVPHKCDVSEKIYSYEFVIYDENDNIFETSGKLLHNHEDNTEPYTTTDKFKFNKSLEEDKPYYLIYQGETANGLQFHSPKYRIVQQSTIDSEIRAELHATMNEENGYADLQIIGYPDENGKEKLAKGQYVICRATSEDGFTSWKDMVRFGLFNTTPSRYHWRDMTVQHGMTYRYSLQQYNDYDTYSNRIISNEIIANFEHSFLYDGKRQLKIKYNPKVTSFKEILLEQKTNTLGSKYPFFFRNGNVAYKEFPISGLISYHSDEEEMFILDSDLLLDNANQFSRQTTLNPNVKSTDTEYFDSMDAVDAYKSKSMYELREKPNSQENKIATGQFRTTNLVNYNILAERIFKLKVLEFLNDDQPKLFRSPGEGNYLVRLMNSSLSPNDQLGRMLHSFSTTASEIGECDYDTLTKYGIIEVDEPNMQEMIWNTVDIKSLRETNNEDSIIISANMYSINLDDMIPGDKVVLRNNDDFEDVEIVIGATGKYFAEFDVPIKGIEFPVSVKTGLVTYNYFGHNRNIFDRYRNIYMKDIPIKQFIGEHNDIGAYLKDIKHEVIKYYQLNFLKRPVIELEYKEGKYYWQGSELTIFELTDLDELAIYKIGDNYYESNAFLWKNNNIVLSEPIIYSTQAKITYYHKYEGEWVPNGDEVILEVGNGYNNIVNELNGSTIISLGSGVYLEASIQYREKNYDLEYDDKEIYDIKQIYLGAENDLMWYMYDGNLGEISKDYYEEQIKGLKTNRDEAYKNFIAILEQRLREEGLLE